eukprot:5547873-Prymnesium_polylepis.1
MRVSPNVTYSTELSGEDVASGEVDQAHATLQTAALAEQLVETSRRIALAATTDWGGSDTGSTGVLTDPLALQVERRTCAPQTRPATVEVALPGVAGGGMTVSTAD